MNEDAPDERQPPSVEDASMSRKITANLYMTLDGRGAFPKYPGSETRRSEPNEQWREMWLNRFDDVTTVVMGRRSFLGHRRVWTQKARKPSDAKHLIDYSRWLDGVDKVCLSNRLQSPGWENSRIMKGDLSEIVAELKREKGGNIIADGGPRLILEFLKRGLADDYWLVVQPVVFGKGPRYWTTMNSQLTLKLLSSGTMEDGELLLHYETVRGFAA
jgi:dihydrofolate reductase